MSRLWLAHAFIAKSVYQFPTTGALIEALKARPTLWRLCGWESSNDVPSEPTFSRAFTEFAADQLPQRIHENMVKVHAGPKLVGHVSRDATAIEAPERPAPKPAAAPKVPRKRGRPKKGEERPALPPKRLEMQLTRPLTEDLADLPTRCDMGCKRNSKGHQESWIGYKLHLDTVDGDLPVSAVLTSASVHDRQVAIPLAQMTVQRLISLYDLMDTGVPSTERFQARPMWACLRAPSVESKLPVLRRTAAEATRIVFCKKLSGRFGFANAASLRWKSISVNQRSSAVKRFSTP